MLRDYECVCVSERDRGEKERGSQTDRGWAQNRDSNGPHYFKMEEAFRRIPACAVLQKYSPGTKEKALGFQEYLGQNSRLKQAADSSCAGHTSPDCSWTY